MGSPTICAAENWKHVCHLSAGHHGPHLCTAPGDKFARTYGGCDFAWPNENDLRPCTAIEVAVLGVVGEPARVRCGLLDPHEGPHRFSLEWTTEAPNA